MAAEVVSKAPGRSRSQAAWKWKLGLSACILYHLTAVLLVPNQESHLWRQLAPWVEPYVHFFELVTSWGFFAPEPGPPPIFIEWELQDRQGNSLEKGQWPSYPDSFFLRERQGRRAVLGRFMATREEVAEKMLVPYFCRLNAKVNSVILWRTFYNQRPLAEALGGQGMKKPMEDPQRSLMSHSFCGELNLEKESR